MFITLEVSKVPAGSYEIGSHPLDGMHKHSATGELGCLTIVNDDSGGLEPRPEPMNDVALGFLDVRSEVGETSLWTFTDLETWDSGGSFNVY